jgi:ABC-type transport system involved in cytochrome c biogenesis permease subunit
MAALEGIALWPALFFVEIPISLWSYEIEGEFWGCVEQKFELKV